MHLSILRKRGRQFSRRSNAHGLFVMWKFTSHKKGLRWLAVVVLGSRLFFFFIIINKGECRDRWLFSTLIFSFLFLSFENCSTDDAPNSISLCYHLFVYIYDDVIIFMQRTPFGQ